MRTLRWLGAAAVLATVAWQTGTGPFVAGVRALEPWMMVAAAALAAGSTVACAWRWRLVAAGLGAAVALGPAVASCYRSQFLNTVLPGGVVGDVHRGLRHGGQVGNTILALRAVGWERLAGQVVQAVTAVTVLVLLPSPVRAWLPAALCAVVAGVFVAAFVLRRPEAEDATRAARFLNALRGDVRRGLLGPHGPAVVVASLCALAAHVATYLLAARAVGVGSSTLTLLPLILLVLVAAGLPANIAGWGPREGMAAWAFGAAGLGAEQGVAAAVAFGVLVLVACLPGAVVLIVESRQPLVVRPAEGAVPYG